MVKCQNILVSLLFSVQACCETLRKLVGFRSSHRIIELRFSASGCFLLVQKETFPVSQRVQDDSYGLLLLFSHSDFHSRIIIAGLCSGWINSLFLSLFNSVAQV